MDDRFFNAIFPGEARILGRELKPFSAWHLMVLHALDSPFVGGPDRRIFPGDLMVAVQVCSCEPLELPRLKPTLRDVWKRWRVQRSEKRHRRTVETMWRYMCGNMSTPEFAEKKHGRAHNRPLTGPAPMLLVVSAMKNLHLTEREAWGMSLGRLRWYEAVNAELEGAEIAFIDKNDPIKPPPPIEETMTEDEIIEKARQDLPPAIFKRWLAGRKENGK